MIKIYFISFHERLKFYRLSGATFYGCINTIYQFIKPFLENKMSIFEEYDALKVLSGMANSVDLDQTAPSGAV